ncbi:MAG TPA: PilZ domain-containing protein, partial [Kofleriaceae bacterium]|nr:PilZ domain-containing protein [Kofleriaceae bacterium]
VEDVSRSGLFLRAPSLMRPGSAAEIELDLPGETLHLTAEIVRVQREPRAGMGVRFVGDPEPHRRPLANFIMRQHATRS